MRNSLFVVPTLIVLGVSRPAFCQQEPEQLKVGMKEEKTLVAGAHHAYTVTLAEGAAILGEAIQHGVDLVIDEFDPNGNLIRTVDSPNGKEGPEPIDLTAFSPGTYRLVIHTLDSIVVPGQYVLQVDSILTLQQNGRRMAEKNYPPFLREVWHAFQSDPKAVEKFVNGRKGKGPMIEAIDGDTKNIRVTYLYYGDEFTEKVRVSGGPHAGVGGILMLRFLKTPLFYAQETVPRDSRFRYGFNAVETRFIGPNGTVQISDDISVIDALNPQSFGGLSVLVMPDAPPQSYAEKNPSTPQGSIVIDSLASKILNESRTLAVYVPSGYKNLDACELLIVFDGETYGSHGGGLIPTPTILDNLIAANKIRPTVAVMVDNMGKRNRDLTDNKPFADFIATELVPWVRSKYRIRAGASHVVVAGSSFGGLASSYCAFVHPETIGNVLSQSGSYWLTADWQTAGPWPLSDDSGDLILDFRKSAHLPIRFYLEVGKFDQSGSMVGTNRELRDVLLLKGYDVTYREFDSGHDYIWWRGSLADGLVCLLSGNNN